MIRSVVTLVVGLVLTPVLAGWIVLRSLVRIPMPLCGCERFADVWSRCLLRVAGVRLRVEGLENFQVSSPQVIVSNHQSWFDVFSIVAAFRHGIRFVAKKELARIPIFGRAWQVCGHISIDRGDRSSAFESLKVAGEQVREQASHIVIFPEGTRSRTGKLMQFKKGAFILAIEAGVPILPVAVIGSRGVMPKGSWRITPGEIVVRVGEPIPVDGLVHDDRDVLRERAWRAVATLKGEELPPGRSDQTPAAGARA